MGIEHYCPTCFGQGVITSMDIIPGGTCPTCKGKGFITSHEFKKIQDKKDANGRYGWLVDRLREAGDYPRAHYCIGLKRGLAGDPEGARAAFERALDAAAGFSWYSAAAEERLR